MSLKSAPCVTSLHDERPWETYETSDPIEWERDKVRWKELISKELTGSRDLWLAVVELDGGEEHLSHCHPDVSQFYYVIEGKGEFTVGDQIIEGTPGSSIYIAAGTWHGFRNSGPDKLVLVEGFNDLNKISKLRQV